MTHSLIIVFVAIGIFKDHPATPIEHYGYKTEAACIEAGEAAVKNGPDTLWMKVRYTCVPNPIFDED